MLYIYVYDSNEKGWARARKRDGEAGNMNIRPRLTMRTYPHAPHPIQCLLTHSHWEVCLSSWAATVEEITVQAVKVWMEVSMVMAGNFINLTPQFHTLLSLTLTPNGAINLGSGLHLRNYLFFPSLQSRVFFLQKTRNMLFQKINIINTYFICCGTAKIIMYFHEGQTTS